MFSTIIFLSTEEKNDKNVATLVEHSKTDLVNVELFDLVTYHDSQELEGASKSDQVRQSMLT